MKEIFKISNSYDNNDGSLSAFNSGKLLIA